MKATIEVPDELYRRVKARAALQGRSVREITIELYEVWLRQEEPALASEAPERWLQEWVQLGEALFRAVPQEPTTREVLEEDRNRLERR
jgi:hypothetical protein